MPELWTPGVAGPLDDFVNRLHRHIERVAEELGVEQVAIELELFDGVRYLVERILPEPGYGFVTVKPYGGDDLPDAVIVPLGTIRRFELHRAVEQRSAFGFTLPS